MKNENFIGVGGLLNHNNRYLLVKHTYGEYKGHWILPGGHVNPGEHIDAAILREFKEETNLDVLTCGILAVRSRVRSDTCVDCYIIFLLEYIGGHPTTDHFENDAVSFFSVEEINAMDNIVGLSKIIINDFHFSKLHLLKRCSTYAPYGINQESTRLYL